MLKILIGFIFIFFNIDVFNFDLLADFIGYFLIHLGLKEFPDIASFRKTKPFTIILLVKSLATTILSIFAPENNMAFAVILAALIIPFAIILIYYIYLIVKGIGELEQSTGLNLNYQKLFSLWKKHFLLQILSAVFGIITSVMGIMFFNQTSLNSIDVDVITVVSGIISVISVVLVIAVVIVEIVFLVHIYRAKTALDTYHPEENIPEEFAPDRYIPEEQKKTDNI